MKLLVISDEDAFIKSVGADQANVLISCGDIADHIIIQTAEAAKCDAIYAVKGNHDSGGPFLPPIVDLHLRIENHGGLTFGGFHGSWKYKPRGHYLYEQQEVERLMTPFPPVDVFVAHNSPRHVHDKDDEVHFGFEAFVAYIHRAQPRLLVHGHQHTNQETLIGKTRVISVYGCKRLDI